MKRIEQSTVRARIDFGGAILETRGTSLRLAGMRNQRLMGSLVRGHVTRESQAFVDAAVTVFGGVEGVEEYVRVEAVQPVPEDEADD